MKTSREAECTLFAIEEATRGVLRSAGHHAARAICCRTFELCVQPTLGFGCQLNVYVLQLGELEKTFQPVMASQAGLFHTAEFHRMEEFAEGVNPNRSGSYP